MVQLGDRMIHPRLADGPDRVVNERGGGEAGGGNEVAACVAAT